MLMSPRLFVSTVDQNGDPPLPQVIGGVPVWSERWATPVGALAGWEYRHPTGTLAVIATIAPMPSGRALGVILVPAATRAGDNPLFDQLAPALMQMGILLGDWPVADDMTIASLEADTSQVAQDALAAWPADWRQALQTDDPGDPVHGIPGAPPSGPRYLKALLA